MGSVYADAQGRFGFYNLPPNSYQIDINDEHYQPVRERADLSPAMSAVVQITLIPRELTLKSAPADPTVQLGGSNRSIADVRDYSKRFPKKAQKEFEKGLELDREGKRDDAMRHYEKALSVAPAFYPAHNNLGSDYLGKSDFAAAQAHFEEAIKLNQSDAEAHLNLANLYLLTKDFDHALQSVQEGLRREPNSALGNFLLGSIYKRTGKLPEAERALHQALQIDPGMSRVHLELVNVYLAQQKKAEASAELKAFLKDSPDDPLAPKAREILTKLETNR